MTAMGASSRGSTLLAVALLVAGLAGVATAVPGAVTPAPDATLAAGADEPGPTGGPTAATNGTAADRSPGADLAGALGAERSTLDGQLQSGTYRVRLRSADTRPGRVAVLRDVSTDLESDLTAIERRRERLAEETLPAGERAHLSRTTSVDAAVLARLAASGERVARALVGADHDLTGRFAALAGRADAAVDWTGETDVPDNVSLADDDRPPLPGGDSDRTLDSLNRSDVRLNESALRAADTATLLTLADSPLIDVDERVLPTASDPEPVTGDAVSINESALSEVDRRELLVLRATGVVEVDALRTNATGFDGETVDSIRVGN